MKLRRVLFGFLVVILTVGIQSATATDLYWSGAGTWGVDSKWATSSGGTYDQAWIAGSSAFFEGTPGAVTVSGTISVSNINFTVRSTGYVLDEGTLSFVSGGVIADQYIDPTDTADDVGTISCGISGSPKVEMSKSHAKYGGTSINTLRFEPSANSTQTLGDIELNYPGGSQASLVVLAGSSTNNTLGSVHRYNNDHAYSKYLTVEGPGKWTLNGDIGKNGIDINIRVDGGTLIHNGNNVKNPALLYVENGRLGGNLTYGTTTAYRPILGSEIRSGGILSPGDGGVGTMSFSWGSSGDVRAFQLQNDSVYEWDVSTVTNDLIAVTHDIGVGGTNFNLDLDNFILRIQDASGGGSVDARDMPVFTYSADVTFDMTGFSNNAANFDLATAGIESWGSGGLSLSNNASEGVVYLVGLAKPPGGTMIMVR